VPVEKLQKTFAEVIKGTSPEEIADMENALIAEGFPPAEVQRLCDVHVQVFDKSLKKEGKAGKIPGHPVYTYIQENRAARSILKQLAATVKRLKKGKDKERDRTDFITHFKRLSEIRIHYERKENQLFPALEAKGFTGPTQVMWGKHDEVRAHLKLTETAFDEENWTELSRRFSALAAVIKKLIFLEEKVLFPTSMRKLNDAEWAEIKRGEPEIGYAWVKPGNLWDANIARMKSRTKPPEEDTMEKKEAGIPLDEGSLNSEQLRLLLKSLPVDLTFVDENDEVRFYSAGKERIFPRSPGIIGRKVQNCHPPDSVDVVNRIIRSFKDKKETSAEFWIQMGERFIHIRYFPVYGDGGLYRGVIEVSQDVTAIRGLSGEKRLLDW
jgi:DUF438 domain-containing protein